MLLRSSCRHISNGEVREVSVYSRDGGWLMHECTRPLSRLLTRSSHNLDEMMFFEPDQICTSGLLV